MIEIVTYIIFAFIVLIVAGSTLNAELVLLYVRLLIRFCFSIPSFFILFLLEFVAKLIYCYRKYVLDDDLSFGRTFVYLLRITRTCLKILDDLSDSFDQFVIGEEMAIKVQKPGAVVEYVPRSERELPKSEQTVILMKKLPRADIARERERLVGLSNKGKVDALRNNSVAWNVVCLQLCGWRNVLHEVAGQEVQMPFQAENPQLMFDMLPVDLQSEIEEVFGQGGMVVEKVKEEDEAEAEESE